MTAELRVVGSEEWSVARWWSKVGIGSGGRAFVSSRLSVVPVGCDTRWEEDDTR
jgi:hypothetical protein